MTEPARDIDDACHAEAVRAYRLDLFLSVDMVGSSAFKFSTANSGAFDDDDEASDGWSQAIRKFYVNFHQTFLQRVRERPDAAPVFLWKALGDELVYRVTVQSLGETASVVSDFIAALHHTRSVVRSISRSLDLKGCGWVADFPARNVIIDLDGLRGSIQHAEDGIANADAHGILDFIGPSMDTGFRLGRLADRRKMVISVELAMLLAARAEADRLPFGFGYDGREALKGILGGDAYPLIWIDVEDDRKRRESNRREAAILHTKAEVTPDEILDFCCSYIDASDWMERPYLRSDERHFSSMPVSHIEHARRERARRIREGGLYAETVPAADGLQNDPDVTSDTLIDNMPQPPSADAATC